MIGILVLLLLLVLNGLFVAAEFAFIAAGRGHLTRLADDGDGRARAALRSVHELSIVLSAAQLGITVASLLLGALSEPAIAGMLEGPLHDLGLPESTSHTVAFVIALTLVVFLHMVIGEMVPKNLALAEPDRAALWLAKPLRGFMTVFRPLIDGLNGSANVVLRLLGIEPKDELSSARTGEELANVFAVSRREGVLEEVEHRLMAGALRFPARHVSTVVTPRSSMVAVGAESTAARFEELALTSEHSRIVVYGRDLDDVLGFVHVKDLLGRPETSRHRPIGRDLVRQMVVLAGTRTLAQALLAMRNRRVHAGLVVDEQGRTVGMVTLEDLLEALVGDMADEPDPTKPSAAGA
jgi:CBS domain containing-hemolysin-like protein